MRKNKLLSIILSCLVLLMFTTTNAYAASIDDFSEIPKANKELIHIFEQVFSGNGEVFDADGADISNTFREQYHSEFKSKEYDKLVAGCISLNVGQIDSHEKERLSGSTKSVLQLSYEESKVHFVTQNGFPYSGKSWYIIVTASGTYGYQDSTGQIISFPSPTVNVSFSDLGALFTGNLTSVRTTTPVINSAKTAASFKVTTTHTVSCPIPGMNYITGTLGPFTNTSSFTIIP